MTRAAVLALAALAALPASAQTTLDCRTHDEMRAYLGKDWSEGRHALALGAWGGTPALYEFYRNSESGTWTIVVNRPDGTTCIVGAGTAWDEVNEPAAHVSEQPT